MKHDLRSARRGRGDARPRRPKPGPELGVRLGYGVPFGYAIGTGQHGGKLSGRAAGMVPLGFDLGGRVTPELMLGVFSQFAIVIPGDVLTAACGAEFDCSMLGLRIGVQLQYHPLPFANTDPWLGAGVGYEGLSFSAEGDAHSSDITFHGFEFASLQGRRRLRRCPWRRRRTLRQLFAGPVPDELLREQRSGSDRGARRQGPAPLAGARRPRHLGAVTRASGPLTH